MSGHESPSEALPGDPDHYARGIRAQEAGDHAGAEAHFRSSLADQAHFKTYERLGELALTRGDLVEATTFLAAAVGVGVNQTRPRFLLAGVLEARGQIYEAAMKLVEALRLNPQYRRAKDMLTRLRREHTWLEEQLLGVYDDETSSGP